ncbi:MAG: XdhC family protein [Thiohalorhabdus sp.]|uniref:XdhC family protein n=1 Tax=Thiohalorhabdus sp. TaxID=3094134 RepID=UPI00397EAD19
MGPGEAPRGTDQAVIEAALGWLASGHRLFLVTVVATWGSSPRPPGSLLALREDGRMEGSVSGGCVEEDLRELALAGWLPGEAPGALRYGVSREEAARFGLPCGGTLELLVEPLEPGRDGALEAVRGALAAGARIRRTVHRATGKVEVHPDRDGEAALVAGAEEVTKAFGPRWRLMVIGAGQLAGYLADMALALDYAVTVCDPRREYAEAWSGPGVALDTRMPDDAVAAWRPDPHAAVVAATHDPKLDDLALLEALASPAFYVGALGSRANNDRRRARLAELGLDPGAVERLRGPMGLPIGSRTPPEIAVSVLAEMTAIRNGRGEPDRAAPPVPAGERLTQP